MTTYTVTEDSTGRVIAKGDQVTNFRGEPATFDSVTHGPQPGKSAKVICAGQLGERYAEVYGLTVTEVPASLAGLPECTDTQCSYCRVLAPDAPAMPEHKITYDLNRPNPASPWLISAACGHEWHSQTEQLAAGSLAFHLMPGNCTVR